MAHDPAAASGRPPAREKPGETAAPGHPAPLAVPLAGPASHDSEARLRAILETAVEGIITIDEQGRIESLNPAAERMFGYAAEELLGRNVSLLMPSPYREQHDRYLENYRHTGQAKVIGIGREVVGQRKDGSVFPMDLSIGEVRLAGGRFFTGMVRDITQRKQAEQQLTEVSNRERRRIGQDLHDGLGQHLTGIELMSESLERALEKKKRPEAAQAAKISRHVREAIRQTRSLAQGLAPVDLEGHGLMAALRELCASTTETCHIACAFDCPKPVVVHHPEVATHLFRIAQEAVHNAVKHGRARQIVVALLSEAQSGLLSIRDNGIGLGEPAASGGLGLAIMRYRASALGSVLEIRSQPGAGTEVRIIFRPTALA